MRMCPHYFLRGSSARLTYVIPHGPIPLNWTTVSSLVQAKCFIWGSMMERLPAGSAVVLASSNVSPLPKCKVPDRTVTRSTAGCQCGGTLKFAGNLIGNIRPLQVGRREHHMAAMLARPAGRRDKEGQGNGGREQRHVPCAHGGLLLLGRQRRCVETTSSICQRCMAQQRTESRSWCEKRRDYTIGRV